MIIDTEKLINFCHPGFGCWECPIRKLCDKEFYDRTLREVVDAIEKMVEELEENDVVL